MRCCCVLVVLMSLLFSSFGARAESERKALRVVVYDLKANGIDERLKGLVSESLLAEIRKLRLVSAMGMAEIAALLSVEEQRQLVGCDDQSCMAEIAGALGSDNLIVGSLGAIGGSTVLSLKRLDMKTTDLIQSFNKSMEGGEPAEALLASIGEAVEALFPERPLREGVERGVSTEVARRLNPPPLPTWAFWTTAATAVGVGLLGGGATLIAKDRYDAANHYAAASTLPGAAGSSRRLLDKQEEARRWDQAKLGLLVSSAALVLAAGLQALFTDWHGYGEDRANLTLAPTAGPGRDGGAMVGGVLSW